MRILGWWQSRKRERLQLAEHLARIHSRLDLLESAPAPAIPATAIGEALAQPLERINTKADEAEQSLGDSLEAIEVLEQKMKNLTLAVSDGIERVDRAERRIHATIQRARRDLAKAGYEDPGVEAEHRELELVQGDEGGDPEMSGVPAAQGAGDEEPSSIPGVSTAQLRRARGFG